MRRALRLIARRCCGTIPGKLVEGVPVLETSGGVRREVLQLSHDPLDKSLFEIPSGFQKVEALPGHQSMTWSQRLQIEWAQLERAFQSWFE